MALDPRVKPEGDVADRKSGRAHPPFIQSSSGEHRETRGPRDAGRRFAVSRRAFLAGSGAAFAATLAPRAAEALAANERLILAPAMRADGSFAVMVLGEDGRRLREVALPARAHDLALHSRSGRAVVFARRPGTFAVAFDIHARDEPQVFAAVEGRHFFGHGAFSADGKLLFATENDFATGEGRLGVYDATGRYRRLGEFATHGIGTHEAILMPDGRTLAIANGGIETNPAYGRAMLNLPDMDPSVAFVDLDGHLVAQHRLPREQHQLSIRHMAVAADGAIWFGTQWEGDPLATPSLVGRANVDSGLALVAMPQAELNGMRRYVGAMAASRDGTLISASAPRGGHVMHFDVASGRYAGRTAIPDCSGVTGFGARSVLAANGAGLVLEASATQARSAAAAPGIAFDNHLRVAQG